VICGKVGDFGSMGILIQITLILSLRGLSYEGAKEFP
jgi:hypothetical protein